MPSTAQGLLVKQLDEAHAMEKAVAEMLGAMIRTTSDPTIAADLESHKEETEEHARKLERCLERYGETPRRSRRPRSLHRAREGRRGTC